DYAWPLCASPDLTGVGPQIDRAVHRLHRGMRLEWQLIPGFYFSCSRRQRGVGVTVLASDEGGWSAQLSLRSLSEAGAAFVAARAFVPLDFQFFSRLDRSPRILRHDHHAARCVLVARQWIDRENVGHGGNGSGHCVVELQKPGHTRRPTTGDRITPPPKVSTNPTSAGSS